MAWLRFGKGDLVGVRFAVNVFLGTSLLWVLMERIAETNPIWAIASMIASSDPRVNEAEHMVKSRLINVLVGGAVGFLFLLVGGSSSWKLPLALAIAVLVSSYIVRIETMWRQAPVTAAIVIAESLTHHSRLTGAEHGLHKVAEVFVGCLVGLLVSIVMSKIWSLPGKEPETKLAAER
jgi:uncharacterized membrane protein YccC